ncbi:MAG: hypothetical protein ACKVOX_16655 [Rhizobacter sp.]
MAMLTRHERRLLARQAVKGNIAAANTLIDCEPDLNWKVELVLGLCRSKAPRLVVQDVLLHSIVDHPRCIHPEAPGSRELLRELFDYAEYPKPRRMSAALYRGAVGIEANDIGLGYYWANNRQGAVIYALSRAWKLGLFNPTVVEAQVADSDVVVATESNGEFPIRDATDDRRHLELIVLIPQEIVSVEAISYDEAAINAPFGKKSIKADFEARGLGEGQYVHLLDNIDEWLAQYKVACSIR